MNPREYVEWFHEKYPAPSHEWTSKKEEHIILIQLINEFNIKSVFEIGTWTGYATLLMHLHPNIKRIKSIDEDINDFDIDNYTGAYCKNTSAEVEIISSRNYKPNIKEKYDMVFIDGTHTYDDVSKDTDLALKFKPKIIVWHDYIDVPDVKEFVDNIKVTGGEVIKIPNINIAYVILR